MSDRPRIAIIGTYIDKYDQAFSGYRSRQEGILRTHGTALNGHVQVESIAVASSSNEADALVRAAEADGVDLLVLASMGYTNSLMVTPALTRTKLPLVLLNTQPASAIHEGFGYADMLNNHGMQGIQDIAAVLVREQRHFGMVTGWMDETKTVVALVDHAIVARAARMIRGRHIGILGQTMAGMGDTSFDPTWLRQVLAIECINLPAASLAEAIAKVSSASIEDENARDRVRFAIDGVDEAVHTRSNRVGLALANLVQEHALAGVTFSFDCLASTPGVPTVPFLGVTKLMESGLAYAGEGDALATAAGVVAGAISQPFTFTEMYTMDRQRRAILHTHMAECNPAMARWDTLPRLVRRKFSLAPCEPFCSLAFSVEPGPITLMAMTPTAQGSLRFIVVEAEVADVSALPGFDIPNFIVSYRRSLSDVLDAYSHAGGPHHQIMMFGRQRHRLSLLAQHLGCEFITIDNDEVPDVRA